MSMVASRKLVEGRRAFVGSVGSYSIILPIQSMIEAWAHKLSLQAIRSLVMPDRTTADEDYIVDLSTQENQERSDMTPPREVELVLTSEAGIQDPTAYSPGIIPDHMLCYHSPCR